MGKRMQGNNQLESVLNQESQTVKNTTNFGKEETKK